MTYKEKKKIKKELEKLSDEDLEKEYYKAVYDCLGSQVDEMYERGYDELDIIERIEYEEYLSDRADVIEEICYKRKMKLWEK